MAAEGVRVSVTEAPGNGAAWNNLSRGDRRIGWFSLPGAVGRRRLPTLPADLVERYTRRHAGVERLGCFRHWNASKRVACLAHQPRQSGTFTSDYQDERISCRWQFGDVDLCGRVQTDQ